MSTFTKMDQLRQKTKLKRLAADPSRSREKNRNRKYRKSAPSKNCTFSKVDNILSHLKWDTIVRILWYFVIYFRPSVRLPQNEISKLSSGAKIPSSSTAERRWARASNWPANWASPTRDFTNAPRIDIYRLHFFSTHSLVLSAFDYAAL